MGEETTTGAKSSRGSALSFLAWVAAIMFIVYPLSPGPVAGVLVATGYKNNMTVESFYKKFYRPLGFIGDRVPAVGAFYHWYIPLWYKANPG
jgi:hypothetical protein